MISLKFGENENYFHHMDIIPIWNSNLIAICCFVPRWWVRFYCKKIHNILSWVNLFSCFASQKWTWVCVVMVIIVSVVILHYMSAGAFKISKYNKFEMSNNCRMLQRNWSQDFLSILGMFFQQGSLLFLTQVFWITKFSVKLKKYQNNIFVSSSPCRR